jgi:hypothetical protein
MFFYILAASGIVLVCLALNAMRCVTDGVYGTTAHVNLSKWNHFLSNVSSEDVRAAGLTGLPLPLRVPAELLRELGRSRQRRGGYGSSLPCCEDPWGHPVIVELPAEVPELRWRVTSQVGRSFFGAWIPSTINLPVAAPMQGSANGK